MQKNNDGGVVSRVWLYSDGVMVVRVVERRHRDGRWSVEADGPAEAGGQFGFAAAPECTAFLARFDRQLTASGFICLWQSEERRSEPARRAAVAPEPRAAATCGALVSRMFWFDGLERYRRRNLGVLSEDWVSEHGGR
jgi:hypothetical protein